MPITLGSLLAIALYLFSTSISNIKKIEDKGLSKVGSNVVIGVDTLTVIEYHLFTQTYTLSNGLVVDEVLVKQPK